MWYVLALILMQATAFAQVNQPTPQERMAQMQAQQERNNDRARQSLNPDFYGRPQWGQQITPPQDAYGRPNFPSQDYTKKHNCDPYLKRSKC
jgi:hypothetical protein